jgi:hypothetical protein
MKFNGSPSIGISSCFMRTDGQTDKDRDEADIVIKKEKYAIQHRNSVSCHTMLHVSFRKNQLQAFISTTI